MKLSRIYSNRDEAFTPIDFNDGLNVVLAEIRVPENRNKDTHNLGKTTLGLLLDFCLLARRDARMFLFKHKELFDDFVFYLELELGSGSYVTIRRAVEEASKISFKRHASPGQDFQHLPEEQWDHYKVAFDRSKAILDGLLDLSAVRPWDFRKGLGYFLRTQDDYSDVFQLKRFASEHADWKPYVAHILGFDAQLISDFYEREARIDTLRADEKTIQSELGGSIEDLGRIEGLLLLKRQQAEKQQVKLDSFDFRDQDKTKTKDLVEQIDQEIADLNAERYTLMYNRKKILSSLDDGEMAFDPERAARLFEEAGVLFGGQIKRDYEQLIAFNAAITEERRGYLLEEKAEVESRLKEVGAELNRLGKRRSETLSFLSDTDVVRKYKEASDELVELRSDVISLTRQREHLQTLQRLRSEIRDAVEEKTHLESALEWEFEEKNGPGTDSVYRTIRLLFDEIVEDVLDQNALLTVSLNQQYHPEFEAEILDESRNATSAQRGHTYKKLLCIAFDLAVLRAHLGKGFPAFVFHDGVFESLDKRKKSNLLDVMREYSNLGIQQIVTLIDTDMPPDVDGTPVFSEDEIVLRLHDEGPQGRLFRLRSW
ncbi:Uncharacterized protein YydD, contains DUF2326 domain [Brevibacterium sandarakinum]|uniref:Uncharacterized protein YydD, contains DUF2326 domain n=1 Tax=Brevibacterium sandarakinum TaxID=629680 RepID=A0A1H1S4B4_BRESA|nr:DUF2326 domain-containing protein [Brevibacterium sandarakinum]SDS42628.1 Uncharacterized protein YydD, contains DUF2326 domain [Brevibacterium sandarakinum]